MKTKMIVGGFSLILVMLSFSLSGMVSPLSAAEKGILDGKTFKGELVEKGKQSGEKDNLIFKDGTFRSTACDRYGFGVGVYATKMEGDAISFKTETANNKGYKMQWTGMVKGDDLEASVVWTKPSGKKVDFLYKGKLEK